MIGIIGLSIFGFMSGLMNGGAYHDYKKKLNDVRFLFFFQSFLSFIFFVIIFLNLSLVRTIYVPSKIIIITILFKLL